IEDLIEESLNSITSISNNLSPHLLRNFGLFKALNSFIRKINTSTKINLEVTCDPSTRFSDTIELTIYRILTELINNSLKHSQSSQININLTLKDKLLLCDYSDNGIGFIVEDKLNSLTERFGLLNIQSRISAVNGNLNYESTPGKGVKVHFKINT
ncbi:MAG: ATP-binding protein, partial [Bacteroidales bacterium]|nr:ATP-binding protein [Bacteroidales bacterium]